MSLELIAVLLCESSKESNFGRFLKHLVEFLLGNALGDATAALVYIVRHMDIQADAI